MSILEKIVQDKFMEVLGHKRRLSVSELEGLPLFTRTPRSLVRQLQTPEDAGIIAEFKRRSPSKGIINNTTTPEEVGFGYERAGAAAVSVLTDEKYFGGALKDLTKVRKAVNIPVLRKDFIVDPYQIYEAKAYGADIVLLIAECLTKEKVFELAELANSLGLEVLMEVHSPEQLDKYCAHIDIIGVNNRNLKTFDVEMEISLAVKEHIPVGVPCISESGIHHPDTVKMLRSRGFNGFLVGERFMKHSDPGVACARFIDKIKGI